MSQHECDHRTAHLSRQLAVAAGADHDVLVPEHLLLIDGSEDVVSVIVTGDWARRAVGVLIFSAFLTR
jgi:hypothetical protein